MLLQYGERITNHILDEVSQARCTLVLNFPPPNRNALGAAVSRVYENATERLTEEEQHQNKQRNEI